MEGSEDRCNLKHIVDDLHRFFPREIIDQMIPRLRDDILPYFSVFIANNVNKEWKTATAYKTCKSIYEQMGYGKFEVWENEIFKVIVTSFILVIAVNENFSSLLINKEEFVEKYPEFLNQGDCVELDKLLCFRNCMTLALKVVTPLKGKKHLLQLVHKMTRAPSDKEVLVTGGGMNDFVKRRVKIYEVEANVTCRARAPRKSEISTLFMESSSHFALMAQTQQTVHDLSLVAAADSITTLDSASPASSLMETVKVQAEAKSTHSPLAVTVIPSEIGSVSVLCETAVCADPEVHEIGNILLSLRSYVP